MKFLEDYIKTLSKVGGEAEKGFMEKWDSGFFSKYMNGEGLDIGYKNASGTGSPILPTAKGIDLDTPNYNGLVLPFEDKSQDYVFSSHTLEHIEDWQTTIQEWFRVLKVGGFLIISVPHQFLYEKSISLPSRFNGEHKRFYTASSLCKEIEQSLLDKTYRIRYLKENDKGHDYKQADDKHSLGNYDIDIVVEKIA